MEKSKKHPSGLTWERWEWPFKTPEERKLVAKYFKQQLKEQNKQNKQEALNVGEALL